MGEVMYFKSINTSQVQNKHVSPYLVDSKDRQRIEVRGKYCMNIFMNRLEWEMNSLHVISSQDGFRDGSDEKEI